KRIAFAEDELDYFRCLNYAKQAGQDAEHSAFSARRNQAWRRRLRIKAAIARAIFGGEDAGLAFKAEDRCIDVRLAAEHARVVHQIARREVVGAVGDDVEICEHLKRVLAGEARLKWLHID